MAGDTLPARLGGEIHRQRCELAASRKKETSIVKLIEVSASEKDLGRRRRYLGWLGAAVICLFILGDPIVQVTRQIFTGHSSAVRVGPAACKTPKEAPKQEYAHEIGLICSYLFGGGTATGTFQVVMTSDYQTFNGVLGQKLTLAKTTNKEERCDILIKADGALPREYKQVPITNTDITMNVAELAQLELNLLLADVMFGGRNACWTPRNITVRFNPDPDTGLRLEPGYIDEIKRAVNNIQAWSKGYIQNVTFVDEDNKPYATDPAEGETWVYRDGRFSGASNITLPRSGEKVTSAEISINQSSAGPLMAYNETFDAFIQGEQNIGEGRQAWWAFMLNRPRDTNSFVVTTEKESQTGLDTLTAVQNYAQMTYERVPEADPLAGLFRDPRYSVVERLDPSSWEPQRARQRMPGREMKSDRR